MLPSEKCLCLYVYYLRVSIFTLKWFSLNFHISEKTVFIESIDIYFPKAFIEGGVEGSVEKDKKGRIK